MMNIQSVLRQMRTARRLGKISNEVQTRLIRRLAPRQSQLNWEAMMRLRAQIEKDIAPIITARREVEAECYQIPFRVERAAKATPVKITTRRPRQALTGYEYTPAWWKEAELRERAARKQERVATN